MMAAEPWVITIASIPGYWLGALLLCLAFHPDRTSADNFYTHALGRHLGPYMFPMIVCVVGGNIGMISAMFFSVPVSHFLSSLGTIPGVWLAHQNVFAVIDGSPVWRAAVWLLFLLLAFLGATLTFHMETLVAYLEFNLETLFAE